MRTTRGANGDYIHLWMGEHLRQVVEACASKLFGKLICLVQRAAMARDQCRAFQLGNGSCVEFGNHAATDNGPTCHKTLLSRDG